jgi:RNA ligase
VKLIDLFDLALFEEMRQAGFVKVQRHPTFPADLAIVNYTAKAQQHYHWNAVTEQCRGLIYHPDTHDIVALPFRKFYNHNETQAPTIAGDEEITAFDKMDGSLGIVYMAPDEVLRVATRGSFTSDQALWATQWLWDNIGKTWDECWDCGYLWVAGGTDMFEIIYPDNRIVVGYDGFEGLVYIGSRKIETGEFSFDPHSWVGRSTSILYEGKFSGLFNLPDRANAEGFVVVTDDDRRVKVKYDEYVRMHRIVSHLSERYVWEYLGGPSPIRADELARDIPEEHAEWVRDVSTDLFGKYMTHSMYINEVTQRIAKMTTRKEKAISIKDEPKWVQASIFANLDKKDYVEIVWKSIKPSSDEEEDVHGEVD